MRKCPSCSRIFLPPRPQPTGSHCKKDPDETDSYYRHGSSGFPKQLLLTFWCNRGASFFTMVSQFIWVCADGSVQVSEGWSFSTLILSFFQPFCCRFWILVLSATQFGPSCCRMLSPTMLMTCNLPLSNRGLSSLRWSFRVFIKVCKASILKLYSSSTQQKFISANRFSSL